MKVTSEADYQHSQRGKCNGLRARAANSENTNVPVQRKSKLSSEFNRIHEMSWYHKFETHVDIQSMARGILAGDPIPHARLPYKV